MTSSPTPVRSGENSSIVIPPGNEKKALWKVFDLGKITLAVSFLLSQLLLKTTGQPRASLHWYGLIQVIDTEQMDINFSHRSLSLKHRPSTD